MDQCQFSKVAFELYELCEIKEECQINDLKGRMNKLSFQMVGNISNLMGIVQSKDYPSIDIDELYNQNKEIGGILAQTFIDLFDLRKFP